MNPFPLPIYLWNHSAVQTWKQLPPRVRSLFNGTDTSVIKADFFIADPKHAKSYFVVTQTSAQRLFHYRADVVVIQNSDLVILVRYRRTKSRQPETTGILVTSIEKVGFRVCRPGRNAPKT